MKTSHEANECARAITRHVAEITGKELPLESCLKIVGCVQLAIGAETERMKEALLFYAKRRHELEVSKQDDNDENGAFGLRAREALGLTAETKEQRSASSLPEKAAHSCPNAPAEPCEPLSPPVGTLPKKD